MLSIWDGFGNPKPSHNEDGDAPKYPQGTHGTPPAHPRGQQSFPNSIFDGSNSIWERFGKDLYTKMDPKVFPKHTKSASWLLPLYPRPLSPQPPSLQPPLSPIGLGGIREA